MKTCAESLNSIPYKESWTRLGYKTYYKDGFVFGYKIYREENGEPFVLVLDVVHEKLNYNPEDGQ